MDNTIVIKGIKGKHNLMELKNTYKGQKLLERVRLEGLGVICICLGFDKALPLHVRQLPHGGNKHSYTLVRGEHTKELHHKECPNYGERIEEDEEKKKIRQEKEKKERFTDSGLGTRTIKVKSIDGKRIIHFNTNAHIYTSLAVNTNEPPEEEFDRQTYKYSKTTLYAVGENLLFNGWKKYIENQEYPYIPIIKNVFYNIYFNKELNCSIGRDYSININDIMFRPLGKIKNSDITKTAIKAFYKIHNDSNKSHLMYILGKVSKVKKYDDRHTIITVIEPFKDNYINVIVNTSTFKSHWKINPRMADKYISCIVYAESKELHVKTLAVIPVLKDRGISVDSNYEVEFAEKLIDEKIFFLKPPRSYNPYKELFGKYNPDFLLLEKRTRKIATIVEVFGFEKNNDHWEDYWEKADKKIEFYKSLKQFNFLYWNAYEGRPIPPLYQPILRR